MASTALAQRAVSITERRRTNYDAGQLDLIRETIMHADATSAELAMFLELCARYELDPFAKQVWSIKIRGRVQAVVAHQGLLSLAERHTPSGLYAVEGPGQYVGCVGDVVYAHDLFDARFEDREDGTTAWVVDHRPRGEDGKPTFGGQDGEGRGSIVGAWARVRRLGFDDRHFIAYRKQYDRGENVWKTHPHWMMLKAAQNVALRQAFTVSGFVGAEEIGQREVTDLTASNGTAGGGEVEWPDDPALVEGLQAAFSACGWTVAKQRMHVNGKSEDELRALLDELSAEADRIAVEGETVDAEPVEEG